MRISPDFFSGLFERPRFILSVYVAPFALRMGLFEKIADCWTLIALSQEPPLSFPVSQADPRPIKDFLRSQAVSGTLGVVISWRAEFLEKPVLLPSMPPAEMQAAISFSMEHHFSANLDDMLHTWVKSAEVTPAHGMKVHQCFVYAVPKQEADEYLALMKQVAVVPLSITPSSLSYAAILSHQPDVGTKDFGVLAIEDDGSSFQIFRGCNPLLSRSIGVSAKAFSEASNEEIHPPEQKEEASEGEASQVSRAQVERLQNSLQSSMDFYHQQSFAGEVGRIFLCGSGSKIQGLDKYLGASFELPVGLPQAAPLERLKVSAEIEERLKADFCDYIPVLGSFLNWLEGGVNLMPGEILFGTKAKARTKILRLAAIALAALLVFVNIHVVGLIRVKHQEIAAVKDEALMAREFQAFFKEQQSSARFLKAAKQGDISVLAFMKLLSDIIPEHCVLDTVSYWRDRGQVVFSGTVAGAEANPVGVCARIVQSLNESPFFRDADLSEGATVNTSGSYRFKITAKTS